MVLRILNIRDVGFAWLITGRKTIYIMLIQLTKIGMEGRIIP